MNGIAKDGKISSALGDPTLKKEGDPPTTFDVFER